MNREILFRGKRIDTGEWVYGLLMIMWGQYHIINPKDENTAHPVDPATVGQYTGLTDKNGVKIFEGDIVAWRREDILLNGHYMAYGYGDNGYKYGSEFVVRWLESGFMLCRKNDGLPNTPNGNGKIDNYAFWNYHRFLEVIGNIHDSPSLLKGA